jgi:hypothetical protein
MKKQLILMMMIMMPAIYGVAPLYINDVENIDVSNVQLNGCSWSNGVMFMVYGYDDEAPYAENKGSIWLTQNSYSDGGASPSLNIVELMIEAGQCSIDIDSGSTITLTYDGGQTAVLTLPQLTGSFSGYIGSDYNFYGCADLTAGDVHACPVGVDRYISDMSISYAYHSLQSTYDRAYWAVWDYVPSGCTIDSVSCDNPNAVCSYVASDNSIRFVAFTDNDGGEIESSVQIDIEGSGDCELTNGEYILSFDEGGTPNLGTKSNIGGDTTLQICIPMVNVLNSIEMWKLGHIGMDYLLDYISEWKGEPC